MTTYGVRQPKGLPIGGQFASTSHGAPSLSLTGPSVDRVYVHEILDALPWHRSNTPEMLDEIAARLNASRNFSDQNVSDTADELWREKFGHTAKEETNFHFAVDSLRAAGEEDAANDALRYVQGLRQRAGLP